MADYEEDAVDLPSTQAVDDRVLKDVVAYVEVRSTNDNRTKAICKELENLGAKIKKTFTDDVTHVVYKEGCKRTRNKAQKKGVFLVSVLWVDSCKQNQEHVSERLYPAMLPDDKSTPILLTKLKKMKSMQPRDFDEDVANSAERCTKRKRKVELLKSSKESTPLNSPGLGGILVLETQPRSPEEIPTPLRLTIPDTPPSMRARIRDLELKRNSGTSLSDLPLDTEADHMTGTEPLIRKLFNNSGVNMEVEEEDPLAVLNREKSTDKTITADDNSSTQTPGGVAAPETAKSNTSKRTSNRRKSMSSVKLSGNEDVDLPTRSSRRRKSLAVTSVGLNNNTSISFTEEPRDIPTNCSDTIPTNCSDTHSFDGMQTNSSGGKVSNCSVKVKKISSGNLLEEPDFGNSKTTVKGRKKSLTSKSNTTQPIDEDNTSRGGDSDLLSPVRGSEASSRGGVSRGRGTSRGRGRTSDPSSVKGGTTNIKGGASRRRSRASDPPTQAVTSESKACESSSGRGHRKSVTFTALPASVIEKDKEPEGEQQYSNVSESDTPPAHVKTVSNCDNISSLGDNCQKLGTPSVEEGFSDETTGNIDPPLTVDDSTTTKLQPQRKRMPNKKGKMLMPQDNLPSSFLIEPTMSSDKVRPTLLDNCSTGSGSIVSKGRKRKVTSDEDAKVSRKKSRKGSRSDVQRPQADQMFSSSDDSDKTDTELAPIKNIMKDILVNDSALSVSSTQSESTIHTTGQHGMSLSTVFGDDSMTSSVLGFAPPRPSIDEFNLRKKMPKSCGKPRKKAFSESSVSQCKQKFGGSDKSSSDGDGAEQSMATYQGSVGSSFRRSPHRPSVVMTSLHSHEQDTVISIVKKIGHFVISDNVSDTTTHVICGGPRRTLNLLYAVSRGSWIVHQKWVYDSLDAGRWLPEETYEVTDWFPSVKTARLEKESLKENYKSTLFSGVGIMYVSQKTSPPRSHLAALIKLCGGQVTMSTSKAQVVVGNDFYPDRTSVSPLWILDCIIHQRLEPMEAYLQGHPKCESSPEF